MPAAAAIRAPAAGLSTAESVMVRHMLGALWLAMLVAGALAARAEGTGDPVRGEQIYRRCQGCHSIDRNRIGPMHKGLFGRPAGSVPGFDYSKAMKDSGIVWSAATLDLFLQGPRKMVPGTKMTFAGVPDAAERADLIAYLEQATKP
jgi:cytochrome c